MKRYLTIFFLLFLAIVLAGCGANAAKEELNKNDTDKAKAKVSESKEPKAAEKEEKPAKEEDIWTYYDDAKWEDDFNGLKSEILKVVVSDKAPSIEDENELTSAVGIKFRMENTTEGKFTTYPDQARLVTSTGEQIEYPEMWISDSVGGEIEKGVIKEGNIIWYLERGEAEKIEWIKLKWYATVGGESDYDGERKEYEIELKLK